ncbi:hypothetical protein FEM48_Zijuj04G0102600 [Ziziphus jujuba var. spinosa]|uniref:Trichome birefringence-like C-terminal domain-containing protein n=1 Tax=Ziziphus jujuba var. spinosa TaxID=714518 RepID=A0A978VJA8_ZIZJJ|nr:hypothetical protein FEM48_Zijuj04G0102600 [Ziziphus jujuba var. spinosa]
MMKHNVHFSVTKLAAKEMDAQILTMRNGVGKQMAVRSQGGVWFLRYNGKETLEKLRGKRVIIVGDSLNRNQWESFACLLYSSLSPAQTHVDEKSGSYKVLKSKEFNCTVEFYWSPFLVQLKVNKENGSRVLKLDKISKYARMWKGADIMVFNTGHWWTRRRNVKRWDFFEYRAKQVENMDTGMAFEIAMKTWAKWVSQNVDRNKTKVFFRSISPEHKGEQWCYKKTNPITNESYAWSFPREMVEIVERTILQNPVISYLNITKLSLNRRDGHPSVYKTKEGKIFIEMGITKPEKYSDCSHWCLPGLPDTWNRLLFASLLINTPKNVSFS